MSVVEILLFEKKNSTHPGDTQYFAAGYMVSPHLQNDGQKAEHDGGQHKERFVIKQEGNSFGSCSSRICNKINTNTNTKPNSSEPKQARRGEARKRTDNRQQQARYHLIV